MRAAPSLQEALAAVRTLRNTLFSAVSYGLRDLPGADPAQHVDIVMADRLLAAAATKAEPVADTLHFTQASVPYPIPMEWLRATFERANSDTYKFKKSRFGNYHNPAISRDWKWFRSGVGAAQNYAAPSPLQQQAVLQAVEMNDEQAKNAERYKLLRRGQRWSIIDGIGDALRGHELDAAIDAELSTQQEQGE